MDNIAWKKFIIKVKCEHEVQSDSSSAVTYFCRHCPSFVTAQWDIVEGHLAQVHKLDCCVEPGDELSAVSKTARTETGDHKSNPSNDFKKLDLAPQPDDANPFLNNKSLNESPKPESQSPHADDLESVDPQSPTSPLYKPNDGSRKRITITVGSSCASIAPFQSQTSQSAVDLSAQISSVRQESPYDRESTSEASPSFQSSPGNEYEFTCSTCQQRFPSSNSLEYHKCHDNSFAQATNEQPMKLLGSESENTLSTSNQFACIDCGRAFASKHACDLHSRVHKQSKNFRCPLCSTSFSQMSLLRRHTVTVHDIVPEPSYLDNPDDKDFELSDETESDSDDSYEEKPRRTAHPRRRRSTVPSRARSRRRKDKQNEQFRLTLNASLRQDERCLDELSVEGRYRMILPRPSASDAGLVSQPFTLRKTRRKRGRQSKQFIIDQNGQRREILAPALCDSMKSSISLRSSHSGTSQSAPLLDPSLAGNFVTFDPQLQYNGVLCPGLACSGCSSTKGEESNKPAHVLTVAAAYASQLPAVNMPGVNHVQTSTQFGSKDGNDLSFSLLPASSGTMVPGIQIYPTPGYESQLSVLPADTNVISELAQSSSVSSVSHTESTNNSGYVQSNPSTLHACRSMNTSASLAQQQCQLQFYPVLGPDGLTTMYYMAAPVEFVPSLSSAPSTDASADINSLGGSAAYYEYANPSSWPPDTEGESSTAKNPSFNGRLPKRLPLNEPGVASTRPEEANIPSETDVATLSLQRDLNANSSSYTPSVNSACLPTPYTTHGLESPFSAYVPSHTESPALAENVEVIDLDATRFQTHIGIPDQSDLKADSLEENYDDDGSSDIISSDIQFKPLASDSSGEPFSRDCTNSKSGTKTQFTNVDG
ncbi:unnamed protein product [Calicophoron daubneyi]|uniref:C2H2-type domain-containing protein n=1 Tax=Calicophoron daubneyi TaxID=300641 RepID=A0AAV2TLG2_CALDB